VGYGERINGQGRKTTQSLPVEARDSYDRALAEGDVVLMKDTAGMPWNVVKVQPEVDPHLPPNVVRLELVAKRALQVRAGQRLDVVRVRTAAEAGLPAPELQFFEARRPWWQRWLRRSDTATS
jgi:hypothetical protein